MQQFNDHTHTYRCGHADASISDEEYVKLLIKKGIKKMAFTDHCPHKEVIDPRGHMRMNYSQKEDYYNSVRLLKEKYKGIIDIELGFEVEYAPKLESYLMELKGETDKLILGQHFVCEDNNDIKVIGWGNANNEDKIKYARYIEKAMEKNIPNVIAHPDLFMLNNKSFGQTEEKVTKIICKAAEKYQIPLEINLTRAAMYLSNKTDKIDYPSKEFWKIASNYDVKVVYGIDAHFRNQIELYEETIDLVNKHIGNDVISKLNFCKNL